MTAGAVITLLLGLALAGTHAWGAEPPKGVDQSKRELGGIRKKIQEEREKIKDIAKKESSVVTQLHALDSSLWQKEKELKSLNQKLAAVNRKHQKANQDLGLLSETIDSQEALLMSRLVAFYKCGEQDAPHLLFASRSYDDFQSTNRYLTAILEQDRQFIDDYRRRKSAVGDTRKQLREDEEELKVLKKKAEQKKAEIQQDLLQKGKLLNSVRQEKQIHLASVKDLEAASSRLQGLINRLEKELQERAREKTFSTPAKGFGALRGRLPFPVKGRVLSTFGRNENPQFKTFTVQKGIEIEAPSGAGIRAVHEGRILYSDWFKGYGKILIIDHGEGYYTLSGHASALLKEVGEEVHAREVVALVGDTGSLKGPCLYFEIRQRGKPLDPMEWLAASSR